jgi:2-phosphosulfolactate phosphatase
LPEPAEKSKFGERSRLWEAGGGGLGARRASVFGQNEFEIRCEWGAAGLRAVGAAGAEVVIIVDVLTFTTAVEVATARGAAVFPFPWMRTATAYYASSIGAVAAAKRGKGHSLSPASLRDVPEGLRLVLPSPNGATLSFGIEHDVVLAGCLRNATAVAAEAARLGRTVAVIPAGEIWSEGGLRPCFEDWVGAGAVIAGLGGRKSPEARMAQAAFEAARGELAGMMRQCGSGKELIGRGYPEDVEMAADVDVSGNVPRLVDGAFRGMGGK